MNIDKMEFVAWMERIMDRLDILGNHIDDLQKKRNSIDGEELLDNQDLLQMLKISNRSLQRYRSIGKLPYYTISGKLYYKLSDVHQFIRESFNPLLNTPWEYSAYMSSVSAVLLAVHLNELSEPFFTLMLLSLSSK